MKSHSLAQFIAFLTFLFISIQSQADSQWYHVELIVFEQLGTVTDEQWPQMPEQQIAPLTPQTASTLIQPTKNETLLNNIIRLNKSRRYQVHYHSAWQQPILIKDSAQAVNIQSDNELIQGNIRLYKSTYLHVELDLWLIQNTLQINSGADLSSDGVDITSARQPNLKESRRIRSKKLYFFDHPKMGALVKLTPIETPEALKSNSELLETYSLPNEAVPTIAE